MRCFTETVYLCQLNPANAEDLPKLKCNLGRFGQHDWWRLMMGIGFCALANNVVISTAFKTLIDLVRSRFQKSPSTSAYNDTSFMINVHYSVILSIELLHRLLWMLQYFTGSNLIMHGPKQVAKGKEGQHFTSSQRPWGNGSGQEYPIIHGAVVDFPPNGAS